MCRYCKGDDLQSQWVFLLLYTIYCARRVPLEMSNVLIVGGMYDNIHFDLLYSYINSDSKIGVVSPIVYCSHCNAMNSNSNTVHLLLDSVNSSFNCSTPCSTYRLLNDLPPRFLGPKITAL